MAHACVCLSVCAGFYFFKSRLVRPLSRITIIERLAGISTAGAPAYGVLLWLIMHGELVGPENICSVQSCFHRVLLFVVFVLLSFIVVRVDCCCVWQGVYKVWSALLIAALDAVLSLLYLA